MNVSFAEKASVRLIPKLSSKSHIEYYEYETNPIWYDEDEIKSFYKDIKEITSKHLQTSNESSRNISDEENEEYFSSSYFYLVNNHMTERCENILPSG